MLALSRDPEEIQKVLLRNPKNQEEIQWVEIMSTTGDNKVCSPYLEIRPACVGLVVVISVTGSNRVSPTYQC